MTATGRVTAGKRGKGMAKNVHTAGQDYTGVQCWSEECATGVFNSVGTSALCDDLTLLGYVRQSVFL